MRNSVPSPGIEFYQYPVQKPRQYAMCFLLVPSFSPHTEVRHLHLFSFPRSSWLQPTPPRRQTEHRRGRCTARARPHRHTITNTTHVTQIRVHLKSSPPPQPTCDVEAAPRSRCPPTRAPAPPRSPPQAAGPPQEHERAQLSGASVEVLRCMRTGPLPPAVGAPGANLSGAEEALIFFGPALACTG